MKERDINKEEKREDKLGLSCAKLRVSYARLGQAIARFGEARHAVSLLFWGGWEEKLRLKLSLARLELAYWG